MWNCGISDINKKSSKQKIKNMQKHFIKKGRLEQKNAEKTETSMLQTTGMENSPSNRGYGHP